MNTNFGKDSKGLNKLLFTLFSPFMRKPEKGAETIIWLATSPEVEGVSGQYFQDKKPIHSQPDSYDPAIARRLWEISEELTKA